LGPTIFGSHDRLIGGAESLRRFLFDGSEERLAEARKLPTEAAAPVNGTTDLDARWVSAHLLALTDDVAGSSVWTALPPDIPAPVKQALVMTDPPVVTLWQPQRELFQHDEGPSVLSSKTRRVVMSLPTSAGKTLVAQLLALTHVQADPTARRALYPRAHSRYRRSQRADRPLPLFKDTIARRHGPVVWAVFPR